MTPILYHCRDAWERDHARAVAPLQAEIEALRAEVERLAFAFRLLLTEPPFRPMREAEILMRARSAARNALAPF